MLYDSEGLDRKELLRLATERLMISHFDVSKLGKSGFRVLVDDINISLPSMKNLIITINTLDGRLIENGFKFRNEFHIDPLAISDVFIPCGGRPEAVDLQNVEMLMGQDGQPKFKYIIEGANLFFTQEARLRLEQAGVVIFKDASANKGGVTSSSMEVLAALSFNDEEFQKNMMVTDPQHIPEFYSEYIRSVHTIIERNAELEFECIWRENLRTGKPKSILSDLLSYSIIKLNEELQFTSLWDNVPLRMIVLKEAFPKLLLDKLGLDTLLKRVPDTYVKAIFGSYLASRFGTI